MKNNKPIRHHRQRPGLRALGTSALALCHAAALAQTAADPQPKAAALPQVIITGSAIKPALMGTADDAYRVDAPAAVGPLGKVRLLDTPNSILILPQELLENAQVSSLKDALKYLPLVQYQEQQGSEVLRPATRGMQSSNFQNSRFDGMTIFVTGANAIEQLQQVEVLSGPASAAYGPASPAGIFNFVAKRPTQNPTFKLDLGWATDSMASAHADLGGPVGSSDVVSYRLNLATADGGAYVAGSKLDRKLSSLAVDIKPAPQTVVEFNASVYALKQQGYPGWFTYGPTIALPAAPDPKLVGLGQSYAGTDLQNQLGSVRLKQDFGPNWHLVAGGLVQRIDRTINTPVNNLTNSLGDYTSSLASGFAPHFGITSNTVYLNGSFRTGAIAHDLTLGTTGFRANTYAAFNTPSAAAVLLGSANIDHPQVFALPAAGFPDTTTQYKSSVANQQGINVTDTLTLDRQWSLRLALSQDWMKTLNYGKTGALASTYADSGFSPMPSLIYKPRDDITTYLTYASSLQQGDLAPAGSANANTGLAPYRSKQWEGGLKLALRRLDIGLALFRLQRPFANVDPADNVFKLSGEQVNTGLEATAVGDLPGNLVIYSGLTILDPKLKGTGNAATDGKQYVGMPKFRSNILLEYRVTQAPGLALSIDWQYVDKRPGNDTNTTWAPSYSIFDVGARYTAHWFAKATTLRLALNNAIDEKYWSTVAPSNITGTNKGNMVAHVGAPRTVAASLSVAY